uniref:Uncharacterized protein n=1 Tax=Anoplophora glabripennis TaxID=217634 RepID=V5GNX0_ANOGL
MAELLDKKKKSRTVIRGAFTRVANEFEQLLTVQPVDIHRVHVSWELLHPKYDELKVISSEIYELMLDQSSEQDLSAEVDACDTYSRKFLSLRLSYENLVNKQKLVSVKGDDGETVSSQLSANENSSRRKFRLPKIEFKRYDGNIKRCLPFWAQFKKIHEDSDIDECDKIEYLIQATVVKSRARQLVESFPAMAGNYEKIIDSMQSRFGREDLQIEVYVRELLKLILNNANSQQKMDLCTLYDKIETQIRALETLGITSDKCSAMLFPLIESCLPHELLRVWQRSSQTVNNSATTVAESNLEDCLTNLMLFLQNQVQTEQHISLAAEKFGLVTVQKKKEKASGVVLGAMGLVNCNVAKCIFCAGSHKSNSCFKARNF